jgi:hypothetical protein
MPDTNFIRTLAWIIAVLQAPGKIFLCIHRLGNWRAVYRDRVLGRYLGDRCGKRKRTYDYS